MNYPFILEFRFILDHSRALFPTILFDYKFTARISKMTLAVLKVISGYLRIAAIVLQFAFCISFIFVVNFWSNSPSYGVLYYFVAMSAFACLFSIILILFLILRKQDDNRLLKSVVSHRIVNWAN